MAHYAQVGIVGYAYIALDKKDKVVGFHCGYFPDAPVRAGKHPETMVQEMALAEYPSATLYSDHVSGPHGAKKVSRQHLMVMLCHHAAREQAMIPQLREASRERDVATRRLEQLRNPQARTNARKFLSARR